MKIVIIVCVLFAALVVAACCKVSGNCARQEDHCDEDEDCPWRN